MEEVMNRVEIILDYEMFTRELLRFRRWLLGWLYDKYGVTAKVEGDDCIVFDADVDVFEMFGELYSEVKIANRHMRTGVTAFGLCSGDECIVIDSLEPKVVVSNYAIKKLGKIVNKVKHIVGDGKVEDVTFTSGGGRVTICMKGCGASLFVNEAFVVAADLVRFVSDYSKLKVLDEIDFVFSVFEPPEPRSLDIDFVVGEDGVILFVDRCSTFLTFDEALKVAYWLMKLALDQLKALKKEEEGESYE
jgi:hypothetical protein